MPRPALELADIFRRHGAAYRAARALPRQQLRVMRANRRHRLHLSKIAERTGFDLTKYQKEAA